VALRLILGLGMTAIALPIAARRVLWLYRLAMSGQPAPERLEHVRRRIGEALKTQLTEVFGQKKLLKWTVPGVAHFFVFWAFLILLTVYIEAYGALFDENFRIPLIGTWPVLGFAQDLIAAAALAGIVTFAIIRLRESPERLDRASRFKGSHLGGAWLILFMIFNVLWTMFFFRGTAINVGTFPYESGAFVSEGVAKVLEPLGHDANEVLETIGLLVHIGVMLVFLVIVVYSKHLHIFLAPLNVLFGRRPKALGALPPMRSNGKPLDFEEADPETDVFGRGKVEDFTWKGLLDFATCTECGRCQSQCPAWNTGKPLSPKMVILDLRDHAFAKAPYILASSDDEREQLPDAVKAQVDKPLVGPDGVIHPDVLWSCTSCGACVEQCPVDIEHVDHIMDMRQYQVMIESSFPSELNQLFKGLETKGNPWNMNPSGRMDWAKGLPFEVRQVGADVEDLTEVEYLFWVGCAGAFEDRQKRTTQAVAELLHRAGVSFAVLGDGETCSGDPARRAGNEFVFQMLAQQNAEVLREAKATKVVATCAHCVNTLKNEYSQVGVELDVIHHTQLLNRLVRDGRLTPVAPTAESVNGQKITYHDPCYIGRHNDIYEPPRELLASIPGASYAEMPRNQKKSFCCGAGGAQMWMEERIGTRVNLNRTDEAVATGADRIAVGCPFCHVMLSDGLTQRKADGTARDDVEVADVAQLLLASVKRGD
jgi:Fe-S oxidoreductase